MMPPEPDHVPEDGNIQAPAVPANNNSAIKWTWTGLVVTFLAMVAQGAFGMLLADILWFRKWFDTPETQPVRMALDLFMFISAAVGKFCIVLKYNSENFKKLGESIHGLLHIGPQENSEAKTEADARKTWKYYLLLSFIAFSTLIISGGFAGLAKIGWEGIQNDPDSGVVQLLHDYNTMGTNWLADNVVASPWFHAFFMIPAFIANLLSFPPIYQGFWNALKQAKQSISHAWYPKSDEAVFSRRAETLRIELKNLYENKQFANYNNRLQAFLPAQEAGALPAAITPENFEVQQINDLVNPITPRPLWQYALMGVATLALTGITVAGITNFFMLVILAWGKNLKEIGLPNMLSVSSTQMSDYSQLSWLQWIIGCSGVFSMTAMAISIVFNAVPTFLDERIFNRLPIESRKDAGRSINILDKGVRIALDTITFLICALGGTPNTYQALLAGQAVWLLISAAIASYNFEAPGVHPFFKGISLHRFFKREERQATQPAVTAQLAHSVDESLKKIEQDPLSFLYPQLLSPAAPPVVAY